MLSYSATVSLSIMSTDRRLISHPLHLEWRVFQSVVTLLTQRLDGRNHCNRVTAATENKKKTLKNQNCYTRSQRTSKWSADFQIKKFKGQGQRKSKTTQNWRRVYLWAADQTHAGQVPNADKANAIIRPNLLSSPDHQTLDNSATGRTAACDGGTGRRHLFLLL